MTPITKYQTLAVIGPSVESEKYNIDGEIGTFYEQVIEKITLIYEYAPTSDENIENCQVVDFGAEEVKKYRNVSKGSNESTHTILDSNVVATMLVK